MKKGIVITGIVILVIGILIFGVSFILPIKTGAVWYAKVFGISSFGGLLTVVGTYLDKLKDMFKSKVPLVQTVTKVEKDVQTVKKNDINLDLEISMEKDYQCVNYLSNRFKSMTNSATKNEGLRLLFEAHGLLYKDYHLEEIIPSDNATVTA